MRRLAWAFPGLLLAVGLLLPPGSGGAEPCPNFTIEGFGRNATGGCGGRIITVTNLNDSGPGSFRDAISQSGSRIVKFAVSGWVTLNSELSITNPNITIDGSDAPNGGVGIRNMPVNIDTNNVIVRHVRFRLGPGVPGFNRPEAGSADALRIEGTGAFNVVLDHISASWGLDENTSIVSGAHDITVQWSAITEGLDCNPTNPHPETCHSRGMLISNSGPTNITLHHNLWMHNYLRNPDINDGNVDFVNNLVYNSRRSGPTSESDSSHINIVGNYFKLGANSVTGPNIRLYTSGTLAYLYGNLGYQRPTDDLPQDLVLEEIEKAVSTRFNFPPVTTTSALQARNAVLAGAGATLPCRDAVDLRLVDQATRGTASTITTTVPNTGTVINDPSDVGGWPDLSLPCSGSIPTPPAPPGDLRLR